MKRLTDLQELRRSQAKIDGHYALVERADGERLALMEMSSASGFSPVRGDDRVLRAGTQLGPVNCSPPLPAKAILAGGPVEGGRVYTKHNSPTRKRDSFVFTKREALHRFAGIFGDLKRRLTGATRWRFDSCVWHPIKRKRFLSDGK